jgi:hypothetical protein
MLSKSPCRMLNGEETLPKTQPRRCDGRTPSFAPLGRKADLDLSVQLRHPRSDRRPLVGPCLSRRPPVKPGLSPYSQSNLVPETPCAPVRRLGRNTALCKCYYKCQ